MYLIGSMIIPKGGEGINENVRCDSCGGSINSGELLTKVGEHAPVTDKSSPDYGFGKVQTLCRKCAERVMKGGN